MYSNYLVKLSFAVLALVSSNALADKAPLALPTEAILQAARSVKPQTGPYYSFSGSLSCAQVSQEVPPYGTSSMCQLKIGKKVVAVGDAAKIVAAFQTVKPATGPGYNVKSLITGTSISREFPPYGVDEAVNATKIQ